MKSDSVKLKVPYKECKSANRILAKVKIVQLIIERNKQITPAFQIKI